MDAARKLRIAYWVVTCMLLVPTAGSGVLELLATPPEQVVASMHVLGYPLYLVRILGFAKIAGAVAMLLIRRDTLTEWAYAGFTIDFLGAAASHFLADDAAHAPASLICWAILMVS